MATHQDFASVFARLKSVLSQYKSRLIVKADEPDNYYLETPYSEKYGKAVFVGAVQIKKNYVSYHLMPVYMFPDLLKTISPRLKKRMQGKSCFNFTSIDDETLGELADLTQRGIERFGKEHLT